MVHFARIDKVLALEEIDLFRCCGAQELICISGMAQERIVSPTESIYRANDVAEALYVLLRGKVKHRGADGEVVYVEPTQAFGVVETLTGRRRHGDVTAEEETLLLAIGADDFIDLLCHNSEVLKAMFCYAFDCPCPPISPDALETPPPSRKKMGSPI